MVGIQLNSTLVIDCSFENLETGIGQDSKTIISKLGEIKNFKRIYPGPRILPTRIRRKYLSILYFFFKKESRLRLSRTDTFYQSQLTSVTPGKYWKKWIIRIHDIFPVTNPEWFRYVTYRNFQRQFSRIENIDVDILTSSEFTKKEIIRNFPALKARILVVPCQVRRFNPQKCMTCEACKRPKVIKSLENYLIAVGTLEPRKNYRFAIDFFAKSVTAVSNPPLVIVGKPGWKTLALQVRLNFTNKNRIIWFRNCCDASLLNLYQNSKAFISFSLAEGFNLPALEARELFQKPLILTNIPVHREIHSSYAHFYQTNSDLRKILDSELRQSQKSSTKISNETQKLLHNLVN